MSFALEFTEEAAAHYARLQKSKRLQAQFKAVQKALRFLMENPRHTGLHTHAYESLMGPDDVKVWEAYAQNQTPGAYRIFWCYYPPKSNTITIIAVTPHP